ncbi:hypothetical protein G7Z17_g10756 [Cylindrodendrum hubeiense]|uniref:Uncharacterized protein n=1 Tax=Cylindrodendrum hubeiense TaxID=595255 RepID=A0A9P5LC10_9HYPO|nr:hypothetical protein G7Z17_g10756 [Cylindrodendrum hubeiense]
MVDHGGTGETDAKPTRLSYVVEEVDEARPWQSDDGAEESPRWPSQRHRGSEARWKRERLRPSQLEFRISMPGPMEPGPSVELVVKPRAHGRDVDGLCHWFGGVEPISICKHLQAPPLCSAATNRPNQQRKSARHDAREGKRTEAPNEASEDGRDAFTGLASVATNGTDRSPRTTEPPPACLLSLAYPLTATLFPTGHAQHTAVSYHDSLSRAVDTEPPEIQQQHRTPTTGV